MGTERIDLLDGFAEELAEACLQRAATYSLLSRLFQKEVDAELLQTLRAADFPSNTGNASIDEGYRLMASYLSSSWENSLTELAVDYVRVFLGRGIEMEPAAFPFESVYTSPKRLLMQEARDEVLAAYRKAGLDKQESWKTGEDHLALEFEFMQILAMRTADALNRQDAQTAGDLLAMQRDFLTAHPARWVPFLAEDMVRYSRTAFYQGLALFAEGFVETDCDFLEECAGRP